MSDTPVPTPITFGRVADLQASLDHRQDGLVTWVWFAVRTTGRH